MEDLEDAHPCNHLGFGYRCDIGTSTDLEDLPRKLAYDLALDDAWIMLKIELNPNPPKNKSSKILESP